MTNLTQEIYWKCRKFRAVDDVISWSEIGSDQVDTEKNWWRGYAPIVGFRRIPQSDDIVFLTKDYEFWRMRYRDPGKECVPFTIQFEAYV